MKRPTIGRIVRRFGGVWSIIVVTAWSASSFAQEPPPPPDAAPQEGTGTAPPPGSPLPPPPPEPPPAAPPVVQRAPEPEPIQHGGSDLDVEARRWAIGYTGLSQVPAGGLIGDLTIPAIGLRYWMSPTMGLDVGLGFGWAGGSTEVGGISMDKDGVYGFIIQGGLPLALAAHRHVAFELIPFADVGYGWTSTGSGTTEVKNSGVRVDVGMRAGFELFFGFIGIPELALNATIGLAFEMRKHSVDDAGVSSSDTALGLTTTVENNPWDIFAGNVSARYYF